MHSSKLHFTLIHTTLLLHALLFLLLPTLLPPVSPYIAPLSRRTFLSLSLVVSTSSPPSNLPIISLKSAASSPSPTWPMARYPDPALRRRASRVPEEAFGTKYLKDAAEKVRMDKTT